MPRLRLETFESDTGAAAGQAGARAADEAARAAARAEGFRAGRAEAEAERDEEARRLGAEIAARLEALSFTWEEARDRLLAALEPLMTAITGRLLPEMARSALAPVVLEHVMPLAGDLADKPLVLGVHPSARASVEALLGDTTRLPLRLSEEPALGRGQVALRFDTTERLIDLDRATAEIAAAVDAFFAMTREDAGNG